MPEKPQPRKARKEKTTPKVKDMTTEYCEVAAAGVKVVDAACRDLALEETRVGEIARKALRMKYRNEQLTPEDNVKVEALVRAIGRAMETDHPEENAEVEGYCRVPIEVPGILLGEPKPERPDWIDATPQDIEYCLLMSDEGLSLQCINMTRSEFIELKAALARMRGFAEKAV